jgi:HPt (histidine-containing phosphotransfer) domain-containing protein
MKIEQDLIWDRDALVARMRGKTDRVAKLINLYLDDMPNQINMLNEQAQSSNLTELGNTAHRIKGVSANLSILRLQHKAAELEQAISSTDSAKTEALLVEISNEYDKSEAELKAFLASL